jgi:hypothetical protein
MSFFEFAFKFSSKTRAIMSKMVDILPFLADEERERVFVVLSFVAQATLDQRLRTLSNMTLSELVTLAKPGFCFVLFFFVITGKGFCSEIRKKKVVQKKWKRRERKKEATSAATSQESVLSF